MGRSVEMSHGQEQPKQEPPVPQPEDALKALRGWWEVIGFVAVAIILLCKCTATFPGCGCFTMGRL